MVPPPAEQLEKAALHVGIRRLLQYPASDGNRGVTGKDNLALAARHRNSLFRSHAQRIDTRNLALAGAFVDIGRRNAAGHHAQTRQQIPPARAG